MADEVTAAGKYLLISVPEFAKDPVGPRKDKPMTSFLRLGAFHEHPENEDATKRALELAKQAQVVATSQGGPQTLPIGAENDASITGVEGKGVFLDDQRIGDPPNGPDDAEAQSLPVAERLEQSAALLTRGGWWDHSDGNRISTTYGDKVEVIRGNYKMVVMSRQDSSDGAGGWDLSGGHIQDLGPASMPGASLRVEFRPGMYGQRGTWHLENTTNNFCQTSDYAGDFYEHWFGNYKHATVGSESPEEWNADVEKPYGNPEILEKTWASKIESYTGSSAWRIPSITEETYADETSSTTDVARSISESTFCDGTITSKTGRIDRPVPAMHEESYVVAQNSLSNVVTSNAMTNVGAQMETTIAGTLGSLTIAAAQLETEVVGVKGSVSIVPLTGEFTLGMKFGCTIGLTREVLIGSHKETKIPDDTKIRFKDLDMALQQQITALDRDVLVLQLRTLAMRASITALQVNLGI